MEHQFFKVNIQDFVAHVAFNRPDKANALHAPAWEEMKAIFESFNDNSEVRVAVLSGEGKHWCAGIDLQMLMSIVQGNIKDEARKREQIRKAIIHLQACINAIELCQKPVLAAIHNGCIGGAVDISTACDIRYSTKDAYFSIRETDMGLVADIGTLQRLPKIVHSGIAHEMAYTGRKVFGPEAQSIGLVTRVYEDKEQLLKEVLGIAQQIAAKSPVVIRGIKENIRYTRDHSVPESLHYIATYNAGFILSNDLMEAFSAYMQKRPPVFED